MSLGHELNLEIVMFCFLMIIKWKRECRSGKSVKLNPKCLLNRAESIVRKHIL